MVYVYGYVYMQITLAYESCANGKWLGFFDGFSHAEHESGLKSCQSRIIFEKMVLEPPPPPQMVFLAIFG